MVVCFFGGIIGEYWLQWFSHLNPTGRKFREPVIFQRNGSGVMIEELIEWNALMHCICICWDDTCIIIQ